jgi:diaminohydroxyphosphoribosylaminopyrimidine deaminase/5-amino-6-(5-phosphoribosylamino)uracil reductase
MSTHENYMQQCLSLALQGLGHVAPNPMVGCVIVHGNEVIGSGYHTQYGGPHAEVNAINSVHESNMYLLKESTLYVNLEPCSHYGKTPPCANLIIDKKIPRVVIGSNDPNPLVAGKGIALLKEAGVDVTTGVLQKESDELNHRFITYFTKKRPYIILKYAQSKDHVMAPVGNAQFWLTNDDSKARVHLWRTQEQAVMIGKLTALIDNPQLTARLYKGKNPLRVVIDKTLAIPQHFNIFDNVAHTLVFNDTKNGTEHNTEYCIIDFEKDVEQQVLQKLWDMKILSVIIEGGPYLLNSFIEKGLWDEARIFTTQHLLHHGKEAPDLKGTLVHEEDIAGDNLKILLNK